MYLLQAINSETKKSLFVSGFKNSMFGRVPSFTGDKKQALKYKALALAESDKNTLKSGLFYKFNFQIINL